MEIKCSKCNIIPEIDVFDTIQGVKFICKNKDDKNTNHYGIYSINNFYKYFIENKDINNILYKFIDEEENNYNKNKNNTIPSISNFIEFTKNFEQMIAKLNKIYEKLKIYFYKILFIKKLIYKGSEKDEDREQKYYSFVNIIKKMEETINYINDSILIKEEFPKILSNNDINKKINEILRFQGNKSNFNINEFKKDFEYNNSSKNNICIKKLVKFDNEEIYKGFFIKLNDEMAPASFIYIYQIKNAFLDFNNYIQIFDNKLNILLTQFISSEKIIQVLQLKDNSILLKIPNKIIIMKIDINKRIINTIQEIESISKFFIETLINDNEISLLLQTNENYCFYKNNKNKEESKYMIKMDKLSTKIKGDELFFIDNYNFIAIFRKDIRFYEIEIKNNDLKKLDLIRRKRIATDCTFLFGIQFIGENKQCVLIGSYQKLLLLSCKYKEIITIFDYFRIERMYTGFNNECYLCLSDWVSRHKIIRQINIDKDGNIFIEGNNYFEKFDFYNKNGLIDLGDTICYVEDKIND